MLENVIRCPRGSADLVQLALPLIVLHHGHAAVDEGVEALAHGLGVVVAAPAGLAPLSQPLLHCCLCALKVQHLQSTKSPSLDHSHFPFPCAFVHTHSIAHSYICLFCSWTMTFPRGRQLQAWMSEQQRSLPACIMAAVGHAHTYARTHISKEQLQNRPKGHPKGEDTPLDCRSLDKGPMDSSALTDTQRHRLTDQKQRKRGTPSGKAECPSQRSLPGPAPWGSRPPGTGHCCS